MSDQSGTGPRPAQRAVRDPRPSAARDPRPSAVRDPRPRAARWWLVAIGALGLLGTLPPLVSAPPPPAWLAPAIAEAVARPLRADLPDSTFQRLLRGYRAEVAFATDGFAATLRTAHRHPDRWLAVPLFAALAAAPWWPLAAAARRRLARGALLLLIPLQLLFHGTSIQPLLGAWVDLLGNLTRVLVTIQIQAYSFFAPGVSRAVALFFAQESPRLEATLQRQLWLLRGTDLVMAGIEAGVLLWLARRVAESPGLFGDGSAGSPANAPAATRARAEARTPPRAAS